MNEPRSGILSEASCGRGRRLAIHGAVLRYFLLLLPAFLGLALGVVPASAQSAPQPAQHVIVSGRAAARQTSPAGRTANASRASVSSRKTSASPQVDVLYSNGPYNGTVNAWTINFGFSVSDSFTVPSNSSIEGLHFVYWDTSSSDLLTTVDIAIGTTSFGGTPQTLTGVNNTFLGTNQYGYNLYQADYLFTNIPWSGAGYITLSNACTTSGCSLDGPLIEWDENSGPSTAYDSSLGSIPSETFDITGGSAPEITTQPRSQTIGYLQTATMSVVATGTPPPNYQWFQGQSGDMSMPISGATNSSYTTPPLASTTSYWVQVSNGFPPPADSATATITVTVLAPTCGTLSLQPNGQPLTISASVTCTDPQGEALTTVVYWGDNTSTTVQGGLVNLNHTYAQAGAYTVNVVATDVSELQTTVTSYVDFSTSQAVFAGQTATVTLTVQSSGVGTVTFGCPTVTDSSGVVRQASALGITCNSQPSPITLSGGPQSVTFVIQTTGSASASLVPRARHRPWFYAFWLPLWPTVLGVAFRGIRTRRQRMLQCLALIAVIAMLLIFTFCGGGFTPPSGGSASTPTPAGSYQVTITASPTGFVQTSLIVPLVVTGP
ncbi:MAG: PKD domain-containing protein [Terriglobales bacterium]